MTSDNFSSNVIELKTQAVPENNKRDIYEELRHSIMLLVDKQRFDTIHDKDEICEIIARVVRGHNNNCLMQGTENTVDEVTTISRLTDSIFGYGALQEILTRTDIEEIFIEGSRVRYIDQSGYLQGLSLPTSEAENKHLIDRLLADTDRTLSTRSPLIQARVLDDTARLTASISPISDELSATIRKYVIKNNSLEDLARRGAMSIEAAGFLWALMQTRSRIVISGEPGAGKTTLLSALLAASPSQHCIRCCEEIREISVDFAHGAYYEVRPAGIDGSGEINLRDLIKFTLAMRPDRIVCGEVRGAEAFELSRAINAGCGFACTVHANNAVDGLEALVNASLMAGENVSESIMRKIFASSIDVVIHVDREETASAEDGLLRGITQIIAVEPSLNDSFTTNALFQRDSLRDQLTFSGPLSPHLQHKLNRALPKNIAIENILAGQNIFEERSK